MKYDIDATLTHMRQSGIDSGTLALAEAVLKSGGQMAPHLLDQLNRSEPPLSKLLGSENACEEGNIELEGDDFQVDSKT